jgi:hypothetical protein
MSANIRQWRTWRMLSIAPRIRARTFSPSYALCGARRRTMKFVSTKSPLDNFTPIERLRKISVKEAAALNGVSEDNFRRHYGHLIKKITPRRNVVALSDAISLPPKP